MKRFNIRYNVGKVKYVVNFHDGVKKHKDGSAFFDIKTFTNRMKLKEFIRELLLNGYVEI